MDDSNKLGRVRRCLARGKLGYNDDDLVKTMGQALRAAAADAPEVRPLLAQLQTLPGLGETSAAEILFEIFSLVEQHQAWEAMMRVSARELEQQLLNWTMANSGAEHRDYLGMSQIGHCPRKLYDQLRQGREWTQQSHLYCYQGYLHERDILARLAALDAGKLGPPQAFSDFGGRFQGHSDGSWAGHLLEIKSTIDWELPNGRVSQWHYWQVQTYMRYGGFARALMIYVARDTGRLRVLAIPRNEKIGELARLKAGEILEAVDHQQPPDCECGWCHKNRNQAQVA